MSIYYQTTLIKSYYAFKKTVDIAQNVDHPVQEETDNKVVDRGIVALFANTDFNTRNAVNNYTRICGLCTHAKNKHSQN